MSRFERNSWASGIIGIQGALFEDMQRAMGAVANGDDNLVRKLLILAPFSAQLRLFHKQYQNL